MIATSSTSDNSADRVERFLNALDRLSESLGLSVPAIVRFEELRSLPPGTLGRSLVDFLDRRQLEPFDRGLRRKQLHDGIHVLTGYDTDPLGEAEVQAFLVGAKFNPANFVLGLGILGTIRRRREQGILHYPSTLVKKRIRAAYWRGVCSSFDPDRWQPELEWSRPLRDVRKSYNL